MEKLTIGKLAKFAFVGVETVRFYQRKGLLREPSSQNGVRTYLAEDVERITFIKKAQELGFSLKEIKELLELNTRPRTTCGMVKTKTSAKIEEINKKLEDLNKMKQGLIKLAKSCDASKDAYREFKVQECFYMGKGCDC